MEKKNFFKRALAALGFVSIGAAAVYFNMTDTGKNLRNKAGETIKSGYLKVKAAIKKEETPEVPQDQQ